MNPDDAYQETWQERFERSGEFEELTPAAKRFWDEIPDGADPKSGFITELLNAAISWAFGESELIIQSQEYYQEMNRRGD